VDGVTAQRLTNSNPRSEWTNDQDLGPGDAGGIDLVVVAGEDFGLSPYIRVS
jgi:hypothetical protein